MKVRTFIIWVVLLERIAAYVADKAQPAYGSYEKLSIDPRASYEYKARGQFRSVFEIAYAHYVNRMDLEMPYTEEVLEKGRKSTKTVNIQ